MLNFYGIIIAFASFFVIGIFHPIVIKGEYYFSEKIWPVFLATGILFCAVSVFTSGIVSVLCALIGGACLWSIRELKEQRKRVQKDRFPQNKKRSQNASAQGKISEAIIIRPIQKKDNGQLSSIIRAIFEEFGAPKKNSVYSDKATDFLFETFIENKKSEYFVSEQNGKILGGCGYFPTEGLPADCAEIVKFYLGPDSRGMKIGTKLFSLAEECARLAGYKKLYIESFPQFSSAVSMYKKNGFTELSSRLGNSGHTATTIHLIKEI